MRELIIIILVILLFFIAMASVVYIIVPLIRARRFIKMEMGRSFNESEYRYWKRELKRLYLRHIPIIGRFFR